MSRIFNKMWNILLNLSNQVLVVILFTDDDWEFFDVYLFTICGDNKSGCHDKWKPNIYFSRLQVASAFEGYVTTLYIFIFRKYFDSVFNAFTERIWMVLSPVSYNHSGRIQAFDLLFRYKYLLVGWVWSSSTLLPLAVSNIWNEKIKMKWPWRMEEHFCVVYAKRYS